MNDEYSDAFKSIVPEAPSSGGWAAGARRKRRNRRQMYAGVAGVAVLALAVPFAFSLQSQSTLIATPDESGTNSPAPPSPDPAEDAPGAVACWEAPGQPRRATAEGATDGAVRAWLCGDADVSGIPLGAVGPQEPLLDGVDEVVGFIQSQQTLDASGMTVCTEEYILEYRIVLDYGDGTSHVVPGELHGCRTIDDGPTMRTGGQELYDLALDLWREQRAKANAPSGGAVVKVCPPPSRAVVPNLPPPLRPMLPLAPEKAVSGFACVEKGGSEDWSRYSTTLEPALVSLIAGSVAADSVEGLGESHLPALVTISGPWGEALTLQRTPRDTFQWFDAGTPMLWEPPEDVRGPLEAVLNRTDDSSSSPTSPNDVATKNAIDTCMQYTRLPEEATAEVGNLVGGQYCHSSQDGEWSSSIEEMDIGAFNDHLVAESVPAVEADVADPFGHLWLDDDEGGRLSIIEDATGRLWWRNMDGQLMEWQPGDVAQADLEWVINYPRLLNSDFYEDLTVCGRGSGGSELTLELSEADSAFICDPTGTTIDEAERSVPDVLLGQIIDQVEATATAAGEYERPTGWFLILTNDGGEQFRFVQWADGSLTAQSADGSAISWIPTGEVLDGLRGLGMTRLQG